MDIEHAAAFMRQNKILHLKCADFEITMHPDGFGDPAKIEIDPKDRIREKQVSRFGQTRAQQREMFGQVFEYDFEEVK